MQERLGGRGWRPPARLGVGARVVVIRAPKSQGHALLIKRQEQGLTEQFVTQASIEALDEPILHGLPRRDIIPFDTLLLRPPADRIAGELGSVVADNHFRLASAREDPIKLPNDVLVRHGCVSEKAYAFPGSDIDDRRDPEPAPVGQLVRHTVERPALVGNKRRHE